MDELTKENEAMTWNGKITDIDNVIAYLDNLQKKPGVRNLLHDLMKLIVSIKNTFLIYIEYLSNTQSP